MAWRAVLALVIIVGCAAGATATAGLLQVNNVVQDFNLNPALSHVKTVLPAPGKPETLFLIGADHRYGEGDGIGNTDTMMLVRIDDSSSTINVMSIPRDLAVNVDGVQRKLNSAYSIGGPTTLLNVLQTQVFPGLNVTHILVLDFAGFANLINEIGCVYGQVDHRYYNYNDGTSATDFSNIDLQPGYQKMCGGSGDNLGGANTALAFVRFRHNDSDIVRQARQQDFLRWAKQGYSTDQLVSNRNTLLKTFAKAVQSDHSLHTTDGLLDLFNLAINANGGSVKTIDFPIAQSLSSPSLGDYLTFDQTATENAYVKFVTPTAAPTKTTSSATTTTTTGKKGKKKAKPYKLPPYMEANTDDGKSQSDQLGSGLGFPVYYPEEIPDDYGYCFQVTENCSEGYATSVYAKSYPRAYSIDGYGGRKYPAYVFTLAYTTGGEADLGTGDFVDVEGTTWKNPPLLRSPSSTEVVKGKRLDIYDQGGAVSVVAWHTKHAVYWISNTLENAIPNGEMIAMAATFTKS